MHRIPIVILSSIDPVIRDTSAAGFLCDVPGLAVISHDISGRGSGGAMRRVISSADGVLENVLAPLEHSCLSCALREDILPTLQRLAASGDWSALALALPVSAEPFPVVRAIDAEVSRGGLAVAVNTVAALLDASTFVDDLFGDDLLVEQGRSLSTEDRRSVGEALAHQVEYADLVVAVGQPRSSLSAAVIGHLAGPRVSHLSDLGELTAHQLLEARHSSEVSSARMDPRRTAGEPGGAGLQAWTLDLQSWRPFHPSRLQASISAMAIGRIRGRGRFWLPGRRKTVCAWDGAGGQLSIGDAGSWGSHAPSTRILFTGIDQADEPRVRDAFSATLLTERELSSGLTAWHDHDDGFEEWLGEPGRAA